MTQATPIGVQHHLDVGSVTLTQGRFRDGQAVIRDYLAELTIPALVQNYRIEAGLESIRPLGTAIGGDPGHGEQWHWGWETPGTQMRGHFLGHWLSAASRFAAEGDAELALKVNAILAELRACQIANGGEWVFGIPVRYLERLAAGDQIWAPQYVLHKTLMGLVDTYRDLRVPLALEIAVAASQWFHRWSSGFSREQFDDMLDVETGGMLEVWADLLEFTGDQMFLDLLERYDRRRLFDPLVAGDDVLTNQHANTTIPEAIGAARAYEVTGDPRWRAIAESYWRCAVDQRGTFATGGQTTGEVWTPPFAYAARRGARTQEHCTVYNMIRLASFMFRWTGDSKYLDYIETNNLNGILAQQHPETGMITYFLPLAGGSRKSWGRKREDFWCCHGSLVQAHATRDADIFYLSRDGAVTIGQYISSRAAILVDGESLEIVMDVSEDREVGSAAENALPTPTLSRPDTWTIEVRLASSSGTRTKLRLRVPSWAAGDPTVHLNGAEFHAMASSGFLELSDVGDGDVVTLEIPKSVRVHRIPDEPSTVAFLDGPLVLAGLVDAEIALVGDPDAPESLLKRENEREWSQWLGGMRAVGQLQTISLIPINQVVDQSYSIYFPIIPR